MGKLIKYSRVTFIGAILVAVWLLSSDSACAAPQGRFQSKVPTKPNSTKGCFLSCTLIGNAWKWSTIGCVGGQACTATDPRMCPDSRAPFIIEGTCAPGDYTELTPAFEPTPSLPPKVGRILPTCGELQTEWMNRMQGRKPPESWITSVQKKNCLVDLSYALRFPKMPAPPEGCQRLILPTSDHPLTDKAGRLKKEYAPDDQVCCMQRCPTDQWQILSPKPNTPIP